MGKSKSNRLIFAIFTALLMSIAVSSYAENNDPIEPINRVIFKFNDTADRWVLKPVAKTYRFVMPNFAERGVRNFFSNLGEIRNTAHNLLQGKGGRALRSTGRFTINTTVGIGGLFDVATKVGIDQAREDLGQTLATWGLNSGPYLVLPLLGPSSLRDSTGVVVDPFLMPQTYWPIGWEEKLALRVLNGIQTRADLIAAEGLLAGDPYTVYREAYLSARQFDINDGQVKEDDFTSDDFSEDQFLDEEL